MRMIFSHVHIVFIHIIISRLNISAYNPKFVSHVRQTNKRFYLVKIYSCVSTEAAANCSKFIKKETLAQVSLCEFCENYKNTYSIKLLQLLLLYGLITRTSGETIRESPIHFIQGSLLGLFYRITVQKDFLKFGGKHP